MKRASIVLLVVMVGIASAAMSQEKKVAEDSEKTGQAEDRAAVKQLSKDYAAAWAKGDPELLVACYADPEGMVIVRVGNRLVKNTEDFIEVMERQSLGNGIRLEVLGRQGTRMILVRSP